MAQLRLRLATWVQPLHALRPLPGCYQAAAFLQGTNPSLMTKTLLNWN